MAVTPTQIPTEILRLLTAQEAAEYRLVPFDCGSGTVRCYGEQSRDYAEAVEELEVLYGWQVEVVPIAADDLHPGLQHLVAQRVISRAVAKDALVVTNEQRKRLGMQL